MRIPRGQRIPLPPADVEHGRAIFRVPRARVENAGAITFVGPERVSGIVNASPEGFRAWLNVCPHWNLPLDSNNADVLSLERDRLICSIHGATFTLGEGRCDGGPCAGSRLVALPIALDDDEIVVFDLPGIAGHPRSHE
jgi:nitrite reductase/ring-hydroxylating ferredoxin subunit